MNKELIIKKIKAMGFKENKTLPLFFFKKDSVVSFNKNDTYLEGIDDPDINMGFIISLLKKAGCKPYHFKLTKSGEKIIEGKITHYAHYEQTYL